MEISRQALRDARAIRKWTQAELAERLDVNKKTIVNWERNGVPPKQAYSAHRVLGNALTYAMYRLSAPEGVEVESYSEWVDLQNHLNKARLESASGRRLPALSPEQQDAYDDYRVIEMQEDYDQRARVRNTLSAFTTSQLLDEVSSRHRSLKNELAILKAETEEMSDGEDIIEVHPEGTKSTYGLAAKKGARKADEIPHAE